MHKKTPKDLSLWVFCLIADFKFLAYFLPKISKYPATNTTRMISGAM